MVRYIGIFLVLVVLSACSPFAPNNSIDSPVPLPDKYRIEVQGEGVPEKWWQAFGSQKLNRLVKKALSDNLDIKTAWSRLKQARAVARKSSSYLFPSIDIEGQGNRDQHYYHGELLSSTDNISFGLAASYELDLWGRIDSQKKADLLGVAASKEDVWAAGISVAAEVVNTWLDLLSLREKIKVLTEQIDTNEQLLKAQERRFIYGMIPVTDVSQQRETLAASKADLTKLKTELKLKQHSLAILLGQTPDNRELQIDKKSLPEPIPLPDLGLPVDLLLTRPDVKAARLNFFSAGWEVAVAKAERLPDLTLSVSGRYSGSSIDSILANWLASMTSNLTSPIFNAGRLKAEVERSQAAAEEALIQYGLTVIQAVKDVQDALVQEAGQMEYIRKVQVQLDAARSAMRQTQIRYLNGQEDYLNFLTQLKTVQSLRIRLVDESAKRLKYRVSLYRALGNDWTHEM